MKFNIGVIGLGVGSKHLDAFYKNPLCQVRFICDFNAEKLRDHQFKFPEIKTTTIAEEVLNDPTIDIVSIASYDRHHADQIIQAFKNRKHVFIEKPLCTTRSDFEKIKAAHDLNPDLVVSTNFVLRREPRFTALKQKIEKQNITIESINKGIATDRLAQWCFEGLTDIPPNQREDVTS